MEWFCPTEDAPPQLSKMTVCLQSEADRKSSVLAHCMANVAGASMGLCRMFRLHFEMLRPVLKRLKIHLFLREFSGATRSQRDILLM